MALAASGQLYSWGMGMDGRLGHGDMSLDVLAGHLTAANQQLVEIARAVATGCRVLVLDEPTSSLDGADVDRLLALVRTLRDEGVAVIYISHVLEEVEQLAQYRQGKIDPGNIASILHLTMRMRKIDVGDLTTSQKVQLESLLQERILERSGHTAR